MRRIAREAVRDSIARIRTEGAIRVAKQRRVQDADLHLEKVKSRQSVRRSAIAGALCMITAAAPPVMAFGAAMPRLADESFEAPTVVRDVDVHSIVDLFSVADARAIPPKAAPKPPVPAKALLTRSVPRPAPTTKKSKPVETTQSTCDGLSAWDPLNFCLP